MKIFSSWVMYLLNHSTWIAINRMTYLPPATKLRQGNVFTPAPGRHPPGQTPPLGTLSPPPGQTHTRPVHAGIHTIPLPSACWDAHALPSVCWDTVNSILLVVVVHAVFICTALSSSVCLNFLFLLKEKMKTGRKGKMSIIFSKWVGLSLPFFCFLLLNKNVYFRLFCGSYLVSRIRFRFHWLEQDCLMYVNFADTGLPRQRENKKFGSSFFQTGKKCNLQKTNKNMFLHGEFTYKHRADVISFKNKGCTYLLSWNNEI